MPTWNEGAAGAPSPRYAASRSLLFGRKQSQIALGLLCLILATVTAFLGVVGLRHDATGAAPRPPRHIAVSPTPPPATLSTRPAANTVTIPSLHISAPLVQEAIINHSLQIPGDVHSVGLWSGGGALDGTTGTVLLAGHVNYVGQGQGALWNLANIEIGAGIHPKE